MTRYNQHQRDLAYRIYVTDSLRIIGENTAKAANGGSYLKISYKDIISTSKAPPKDGNQIVADIIKRAGIEVRST